MKQKEISKEKTFPELLKYQRELRGWSQAKMAEEIGSSPNRISSWERGVMLPSAYFREKLCHLLSMNAQELGLITTSTVVPHPQENDLSEESNITSSFNPIDSITPSPRPLRGWLVSSSHLLAAGKRRYRIVALCVLIGIVLMGLLITSFYSVFDRMFASSQANPYVPGTGQLVLNDTLRDQSQNMNWQEGTNDQQANCTFKDGGYVAFQPLAGRFHACSAQKADYTNFAYEVLMTIQQGEFRRNYLSCRE